MIRAILVLTACLVTKAEAQNARPEWFDDHTDWLSADARYLYGRGEGHSANAARHDALRGIEQRLSVAVNSKCIDLLAEVSEAGHVKTSAVVGCAVVTRTATIQMGVEEIRHEIRSEHFVILRADRRSLPPELQARVGPERCPGGGPGVSKLLGRRLELGSGSSDGILLDDGFEIRGPDERLPICRPLGLGRVGDLEPSSAAIELLDYLGPKTPSAITLRPTGDLGLRLGLGATLGQSAAPAFSGGGLRYAPRSVTPGVRLEISWNLGRYVELSELWVELGGSLEVASKLLTAGLDLGVSKLHRFGAVSLGGGAALSFRTRHLDTSGGVLFLEDGEMATSLSQSGWGARAFGELSYSFDLRWSIALRLGFRAATTSGTWSALPLGYSLDDAGFFGEGVARVRL